MNRTLLLTVAALTVLATATIPTASASAGSVLSLESFDALGLEGLLPPV